MAKIKRDNLQALARIRLNEARLLMEGGSFAGAYYLTGLALEFGIMSWVEEHW